MFLQPLAKFVALACNLVADEVLFLAVSFVGSLSFAEELRYTFILQNVTRSNLLICCFGCVQGLQRHR